MHKFEEMLQDIEAKNGMFLSVRKVNSKIVISVLDMYEDPEYYEGATLQEAMNDYWTKQAISEAITESDQEDQDNFYYN